jgi:hypothetical protein
VKRFTLTLTLALALAPVACGGAPPSQAVVAIPAQPAPVETAIATAPDAVPHPEPPRARLPPPPLPAGANGPRDAREMIGDAGELAPAPHRATLLVSSAAVRAHPWGDVLGKAITAVFSGWGDFMPYDVVHPTKDVDWVMMSGSLVLGSTQQNVFVARHNLTEPKADAAAGALLKRLPAAKKTDVGVKGVVALTAHIDGADRLYLRPKPGVLAIVPPPEAKRAVELLRRVELPASVRAGELVRVAYSKGTRLRMFSALPSSVDGMRAWLEAAKEGGVVAHAELDCGTAEQAAAAADDLADRIGAALSSPLVRVAFGALKERMRIWPDGATVRVRAELAEEELRAVATLACARTAACAP